MPLAWLAKPVSRRLVLVTRIFPLIVFIYQRSTHLIRQSYRGHYLVICLPCRAAVVHEVCTWPPCLMIVRTIKRQSSIHLVTGTFSGSAAVLRLVGHAVGWLEFTGTFNTDRLYHAILLWGHFLWDHPACATITGFFFPCSYCIYYKVRSTLISDAVVHCHTRAKGYFKPRKIHTKRWRIYGAKEGRKSSVVPQTIV